MGIAVIPSVRQTMTANAGPHCSRDRGGNP